MAGQLTYIINNPQFSSLPAAMQARIRWMNTAGGLLRSDYQNMIYQVENIWAGQASAAAQAERDNRNARIVNAAQGGEAARFAVAQYNAGLAVSDPYFSALIKQFVNGNHGGFFDARGKIIFASFQNECAYAWQNMNDSGTWLATHGRALATTIAVAMAVYIAWEAIPSASPAPAGTGGGGAAAGGGGAAAGGGGAAAGGGGTAAGGGGAAGLATTAGEVASAATALRAAFNHPTPPSVPPQQPPTQAAPAVNQAQSDAVVQTLKPLLIGAAIATPFVLP